MLELLSSRRNVWGEIRLLASARSAGKQLSCRGEQLTVRELTPEAFDGVDVAMFDVPDEVSLRVGADRRRPRRDRGRQLGRVPDGAGRAAGRSRGQPGGAARPPARIVSNANCTVMAMIMAIAPLHREYGLRELVLASYQAASGAGQFGVDTLHDQLSKVAGDRLLGSRPGNVRQAIGDDLGPFSAPLALNVVPWSGALERARLVVRGAQAAQRVPQDPRHARR